MLASAVKAESASAGISAIGGIVASITTLSGGEVSNELWLSLDFISGTSVLAGSVETESATSCVDTVR